MHMHATPGEGMRQHRLIRKSRKVVLGHGHHATPCQKTACPRARDPLL